MLRAWVKHFDPDYDQSVSAHEFSRGLRFLGFKDNTNDVMRLLDDDSSGEISLSEIDAHAALLWRTFRRWCVTHFADEEDMLAELGGLEAVEAGCFTKDNFMLALKRLGWFE